MSLAKATVRLERVKDVPGILFLDVDVRREKKIGFGSYLRARIGESGLLAADVAEHDDSEVAACMAKDAGRLLAFISEVYVDPDKRSQHVGTTILTKALQVLKDEKVYKVFLAPVSSEDEWQSTLIRFYIKNGFIVEGECSGDPNFPVMSKVL